MAAEKGSDHDATSTAFAVPGRITSPHALAKSMPAAIAADALMAFSVTLNAAPFGALIVTWYVFAVSMLASLNLVPVLNLAHRLRLRNG
jgi:hypothetical protein